MKKVLITGGAGFVGANFVHKFLALGHEVFVVERRGANLWRLEKVKSNIKIYFLDIADSVQIERCVQEIKPEIVLHFATYGAYQRFQQDVKTTIDTNLTGTIHLLNACLKANVACVINTSSSSEYGIKEMPMKEDDVLEPNNLYGITKSAATYYATIMAKKMNLPVVTTRLFSVYGPLEEKERLIPSIVLSCINNKDLALSKPTSVRDYIFIDDVVDAYCALINNIHKVMGEVFNIGTGNQSTIAEVVTLVQEITGSSVTPEYDKITVAQTEPVSWVANTSKMESALHWKPTHSLKEGLKKNVAWFKDNMPLYEKK